MTLSRHWQGKAEELDLADAETGAIGRRSLPTSSLWRATAARLEGESVVWTLPSDLLRSASAVESYAGMLDAFVRLADHPDRIPAYVLRFGPIRICEAHGEPIEHVDGECYIPFVRRQLGGVEQREAIGHWVRWSTRLRLLLEAGIVLLERGTLTEEQRQAAGMPDNLSPDAERLWYGAEIDMLLDRTGVRAAFQWDLRDSDDDLPRLVIKASPLGQLTLQLAAAVARSRSWGICQGCQQAFPRNQVGRLGRPAKYCGKCRDEGVPARDRKRRQRTKEPPKGDKRDG